MPLTVTGLARACGLSRSTILYYERAGLLRAAPRSSGNYRLYSDRDLDRLCQIRVYRNAGLAVGDIRSILDRTRSDAAGVLKRRMAELNVEIERLRDHQRVIARLLKDTNQLRRLPMVTKQKWVEIMRGAGFTEEDMRRWHAEFEKSAPQEHQEFLEFLHIPTEEIATIRAWSKSA
jgi:DNA-binding transcriptional MerR regulator